MASALHPVADQGGPFVRSHAPDLPTRVKKVEGANVYGESVVLRAGRGGQFVSLRTRERIAERKRTQLEAEGWIVEVVSPEDADHLTLVPYVPPSDDRASPLASGRSRPARKRPGPTPGRGKR